ncbi:hypothetical protein TRICI_002315 [Trichomonascus ciferrii]|uniref:DNA/RNA-binding protein Alba-like domain-containing protein n=1 Tax=Trichomonascus ciferrii TaxID=44093 RepID=A0A642V692_9ASCO|nr:hypothetical protein TRICI_002315 [Trichomonascus ciferrii]
MNVVIRSGDDAKPRASYVVKSLKESDNGVVLESKNGHAFQKLIAIAELVKQQLSKDRTSYHQYNTVRRKPSSDTIQMLIRFSLTPLSDLDSTWTHQTNESDATMNDANS